MAAEGVKLLGMWASPFVLRARIALNLKGINYDYSEEVLADKSELLLKYNPIYKKVPVLIHSGEPICESMIIVQYIEDVWGKSGTCIMPSDPYERAVARFWAVYVDHTLLPSVISILKAKAESAKAEATEQAVSGLQLLEDFLEKNGKEKHFFGGDTVGYLDICLGSILAWIRVAEVWASVKIVDGAEIPRLVEWAKRFCMHDSVRGEIPEVNRLVEHWKGLQSKGMNANSGK